MTKQQFIEWYNKTIWNLPKDFPRPSNARLVHCKCGAKHCIGKHPCQGWKWEKHVAPKPVPNMGKSIVVYATISQPEKPTWASENQKREARLTRQRRREKFQQKEKTPR